MAVTMERRKAKKPKAQSLWANEEFMRLLRIIASDERETILATLDKYCLPTLQKAYRRMCERDTKKG